MTFHDIVLKSEYRSITDDVYADFFNIVLKHSATYSRIGGKFTSKDFAACAEGLQEFIRNDGNMKLVLMPEFSMEDVKSINQGIKNASDVISDDWIKDFSEIKEKFIENHTKALAWMLANNHLEIKLVFPVDGNGQILPDISLQDTPMFKHKTGIFWDKNFDIVSFSGNIDFNDKMFGEYYHFSVYRAWDESEKKFVDDNYAEFSRYWDGQRLDTQVTLKTMSLPTAVKENLIKIAPKSKSEIILEHVPKLRPYQKTAIRKWLDNDYRGIFEMATGTGKTFTAIGCINEIIKTNEKLLVVIVCPFDNLERQWQKELKKWNFNSSVTSRNPKWDQNLRDRLATLETNKDVNISIVITTYKTFCKTEFLSIVEHSNIPRMLIADEVHNAGTANSINGLSNAYDYRLGLSATLERYFDPEGTSFLTKFFGNTVYELDLKSAIEDGFLVGYYYHTYYVDLTEEEYKKYRAYGRKIAQLWDSKNFEDRKQLESIIMKRSRIIKYAENKLIEFKNLTKKHQNIKHLLVYCPKKHMPLIKKILNQASMTNREITAQNPSNSTERMKIINEFSSGVYDVILADGVLDEGADIPSAKNCIMLASTGNPKQFVQRRGRVLRKFNGIYSDGTKKEHAVIHDVLIIPDISSDYNEDEIRTERQIVISQIKRLEDMAKIAINHDSCMKEIQSIKEKFSIK